jgi:formate dehydrogenase subunit gamma
LRPDPKESLVTGNSDPQQAAVEGALQRYRSEPGPLLLVLHAVQDALGYIPPGAVPQIALGLNLSRAEVHGVVTFYHYFRSHPPGRMTVEVCRAEACQAVGAEQLAAHAKRALGVDFHETRADGAVSLQPVYCLGNCACGPSIRVGGQLHGRVTAERFDELTRGTAR